MYFLKNNVARWRLSFIPLLLVLASCAKPVDAAQPMGPADFIINTVMFFLLGLFIYYMLILKPQQEAESQQKEVEGLNKNDKVVTTGGIFGRVQSITDGVVTMEISPNVKIRVLSSHVLPDTTKKDSDKKK